MTSAASANGLEARPRWLLGTETFRAVSDSSTRQPRQPTTPSVFDQIAVVGFPFEQPGLACAANTLLARARSVDAVLAQSVQDRAIGLNG